MSGRGRSFGKTEKGTRKRRRQTASLSDKPTDSSSDIQRIEEQYYVEKTRENAVKVEHCARGALKVFMTEGIEGGTK